MGRSAGGGWLGRCSSGELPCGQSGAEGWRGALAQGAGGGMGAKSLEPGVLRRKALQGVGWGGEERAGGAGTAGGWAGAGRPHRSRRLAASTWMDCFCRGAARLPKWVLV